MSAPDHEPHRSRRFLLLLKGRPHLSQSFPTLGLRANCALPNLPRLNQRYGFDRLRTSTYNQKLDCAAFSRSSPTGWKKFATGPQLDPWQGGDEGWLWRRGFDV